MYSFGFEACLQAATTVVKHLIDMHAPLEILRYVLDCFFVMGEFCTCSCSRYVGCHFFFCGCSE
ncbi:hypothetical protein JB92DRAFT_2839504 [Gautieria morchelliformis]|nr:hypothetical protein JB92DRAFT_2839504 [Gautieria morchelliformis]